MPILRDVDKKDLLQLSQELHTITEKLGSAKLL